MCIEETQDGGFGFCRTVVDTVAERLGTQVEAKWKRDRW